MYIRQYNFPLKPDLNFVYPGSIQRIRFAEMHEPKGFVEGEILSGRIETRLIWLPTYPMEIIEVYEKDGPVGRL